MVTIGVDFDHFWLNKPRQKQSNVKAIGKFKKKIYDIFF